MCYYGTHVGRDFQTTRTQQKKESIRATKGSSEIIKTSDEQDAIRRATRAHRKTRATTTNGLNRETLPNVGATRALRHQKWVQEHAAEQNRKAEQNRASKMREAASKLMVSSSPTAQKQLQTIADTYIGVFTTTERRDGWPEHHRAAAQLALGHSGGKLRVYAADKLLLVFRASAPKSSR